MRYICNAPGGKTWFRLETEAEAEEESVLMRHAVARYFRSEMQEARARYRPPAGSGIERDIGLKDHLARTMPLFLTLRADDGTPLATAMIGAYPPVNLAEWSTIIVGPANADPYASEEDAIEALAMHLRRPLPRATCYPYQRAGA